MQPRLRRLAPFRNQSLGPRQGLLNCTSTCGLWIQAAYVYTLPPPQTSLIYLQKPANSGHPTSPSPLILMSADTVCTVENSAEGIHPRASRLCLFITLLLFLCFGRRINKATLMQIRLGRDADSELHKQASAPVTRSMKTSALSRLGSQQLLRMFLL